MEQATLDQSSTEPPRLLMAMELSKSTWQLGFSDGSRYRAVTVRAGDLGRTWLETLKAKKKFGLAEDAPVVSCYEAGRDGFWIHRWLTSCEVTNVVIEPASIAVDRRARRRKTDRLDVRKMLSMLARHVRGEKDVWREVRVPSPEDEDARRPHRERERLVKERTAHRARLRSLLTLHGLDDHLGRGFAERVERMRGWDGTPLPAQLRQELVREYRRLQLVQEQIAEVETKIAARVKQGATKSDRDVRALAEYRGIAYRGASVLVYEFFGWRKLRNRREVAALAGLTGTPYNSGDSIRDQGISKAGNRRVRTMMIELAWGWLRWQPESKLAQWFRRRTGPGKRMRRVMIVALARKLLVALWRYLEEGVVPEGAILSTRTGE